jgi:hypothetical protein
MTTPIPDGWHSVIHVKYWEIIADCLVHEGPLLTGVPGLDVEFAVQTQCIAAGYVNRPKEGSATRTGQTLFDWGARMFVQHGPTRSTLNRTGIDSHFCKGD